MAHSVGSPGYLVKGNFHFIYKSEIPLSGQTEDPKHMGRSAAVAFEPPVGSQPRQCPWSGSCTFAVWGRGERSERQRRSILQPSEAAVGNREVGGWASRCRATRLPWDSIPNNANPERVASDPALRRGVGQGFNPFRVDGMGGTIPRVGALRRANHGLNDGTPLAFTLFHQMSGGKVHDRL